MKTGKTLQDLAAEISRRGAAKTDLVIDTRELTLLAGADGGLPELSIPGEGEFAMTRTAERQMADRLKYPIKLWDRFRADYPGLLTNDINTIMRQEPERRMVRAYDFQDTGEKTARAFLSERYRRLDNEELLEAILPVILEIPDAEVISSEVTESRMYLKVTTPRISGEVAVGDVIQAGFILTNSEVGAAALSIRPYIYRLICTNGMVAGEATRRYHVGRTVEAEGDTYRVFSDETQRADDHVLFLKLRDVTRAAVSETTFNAIIAQMKESALTVPMADPVKGIERLAKKLDLSEPEKGSVMAHLISGADLTCYGALNAVTRTAEDSGSYDRATDLEAAGGRVLAMAGTREWAEVAA